MEARKSDLEAVVASQKEQLGRYEKRLKDVVTAYKGLLKEKEALETSLTAITKESESSTTNLNADLKKADNEITDIGGFTVENAASNNSESQTCSADNDKSNLQTQIMTLMNSLATLSAEKSRMEASFQADKKQMRAQLTQKDQTVAELKFKVKECEKQGRASVDEMKAKWIIERQEREQESNNQMLMIRELQKLYADERHLKENIEMQLNNLKTQFASNEAESNRMRELQMHLKEARSQLKQLQASNSGDSAEMTNNAAVLKQVQREMQQLKEQHAIAIKMEQQRVKRAEEQSRKQAELHEDRVANLESRLAELSSTVGNYDRVRQQDQDSIQILKRKLQELERNAAEHQTMSRKSEYDDKRRVSLHAVHDITEIVDEIVRLKKLLITENARAANPINVFDVFSHGAAEHVQCQEDLKHAQQQYETVKAELSQLQEKFQQQKSHIAVLQEKVQVLNRNIDEQELELKQQTERLRQAVKEERSKWLNTLKEKEHEYRAKCNDLEQQLQKQRQRSLQLLEEKEQEIKTLHTSFEVFHNATIPTLTRADSNNVNADVNVLVSSDAESNDDINIAANNVAESRLGIKAKRLSVGDNCHMLYYANEIARKDIEIVGLRKAKYSAETSLRKAIQDKVTAQEELCDKIAELEEQVDRLERCQTREGANLEYLKNVIISFIVTKDADGKRHMMNAISAVLQFTASEINTISAAFHKK